MIPLLFEDVKFGALQQRRAGRRREHKKSILNVETVNLQTNLIISHEHQAFIKSWHTILTKRAYSSSSTEANKQAYKQLSVLPFYHIFPFHRIQILNWTEPNEHHTFICYFVKMKNERSSGERRVCTIRHLSLSLSSDDIGPLNLNIIEFYITLRNQIHWIEHFSTNCFDDSEWVWWKRKQP